jgi:ABC-type xylose transport system permease subunit
VVGPLLVLAILVQAAVNATRGKYSVFAVFLVVLLVANFFFSRSQRGRKDDGRRG